MMKRLRRVNSVENHTTVVIFAPCCNIQFDTLFDKESVHRYITNIFTVLSGSFKLIS